MLNTNPISDHERMQSIDVIRGFAILGIFLVNMSSFHSPALYLGTLDHESALDSWITSLIDIFAQASFYTLFSFLFGFGMIIFLDRAKAKGHSYKRLYMRRLIVLLVIGIIHATLIWHGDILITYALIGGILLLFYQASPKGLFITSLSILLVPAVLLSGLLLLLSIFSPENAQLPRNEMMIEESFQHYKYGTFFEATSQRVTDYFFVNNFESAFFLLISLLPLFLLGAYVAKVNWFKNSKEHKKMIWVMWGISLVTAVPTKLLPYLTTKNVATEYIQDAIGGPALALFYATSIVLLMEKSFWHTILKPFSYVGRLSLSNYLLQSIICTTIFYGYGLGFYGEITYFQAFLLTIFIYISQVICSYIWLRYFVYGPIEWVWRSLTYGRVQPFKRREG
ncbi:uncharacterized protein JOC85_000577 [Bacillus mesophilus]|uniref:DUF418 domain-containing protein n=1 Tax=Bacillus mesophilus TaxID=1808955 RepID=A0A6M0Q4G2_9BACI|nr:DUF418 domain-containing protein [Bacillus mesophilus]MBM7659810.1 uncharacterized protein [Bacillus mesophilus]NEY70669.1 DUF418 domain-containing protein [Bacillus mesophilus]